MKKKKTKFTSMSRSSKPTETMSGETQKGNASGNKADRSLNDLMKGNVLPSFGKTVKRPTGANKDRRTR